MAYTHFYTAQEDETLSDETLSNELLTRVVWILFAKEIVAQELAKEIRSGAEAYVERHRAIWAQFPNEMDVLDRMDLEKRALVRGP